MKKIKAEVKVDFIASLWVVWTVLFFIGLAGLILGVVLMFLDPLMLLLGIFGGFNRYWKICCAIMLTGLLFLFISGFHSK